MVGIGLGFGGDLLIRPSTTTATTTTATEMSTATKTVTQPAVTQTQPAVTQTVTTTSIQQPTTLSYIPPLSPSVQATVTQIVNNLLAVGAGETTYAASPGTTSTSGNNLNGGLVTLHVKNGILTRADANWAGVHINSPREDYGISKAEMMSGNMQPRGGPMSYATSASIYDPNRVLYPMQRVAGTSRGNMNGQFTRITWDQALDTISC